MCVWCDFIESLDLNGEPCVCRRRILGNVLRAQNRSKMIKIKFKRNDERNDCEERMREMADSPLFIANYFGGEPWQRRNVQIVTNDGNVFCAIELQEKRSRAGKCEWKSAKSIKCTNENWLRMQIRRTHPFSFAQFSSSTPTESLSLLLTRFSLLLSKLIVKRYSFVQFLSFNK